MKYSINSILSFIFKIIIFIVFSESSVFAGNNTKYVNILTWWGYLDDTSVIDKAEKLCNIKLSFDQYYSTDEFLRRWRIRKDSYDIIIFSGSIYKVIKNEIPNYEHSRLNENSNQYNRTIKLKYLSDKFPKNIIYFLHSLTGFTYNPEIISMSVDDSLPDMFDKAKGKLVVMLDDSIEINNLLKLNFKDNDINDSEVMSIRNFNKLTHKSSIYIGNGFRQIYKDNNFAFAFAWSGEAIANIMSNKKLKFLIHPKLSYISTDLLAQVNKSEGAKCVSQFLASRDTLSYLENKLYYFSPYTESYRINDASFLDIYKGFIMALPTISWIGSVDQNNFDKANQKWDLIKLNLLNNKINAN